MDELTRLVELARDGDRDAFAALYDRYARLVRAIAFDVSGELAAAEDIAQDVFLKAFSRLHQLRTPERFVSWLSGIARLAALDWRRTKRRDRHEFGEPACEAPSTTDDPSEFEELRQAIRRLPRKERMALHIFYLDEQPAETARAAIGLSCSGFYKLLDRARQRTATIMRQNQETRK